MGELARESYRPGDQLDHLGSGEVWKVVRVNDLADDEWSEGMVPLTSDYLIRLIHDPRPGALGVGALRRVHSDYLHGSGGWRRRQPLNERTGPGGRAIASNDAVRRSSQKEDRHG